MFTRTTPFKTVNKAAVLNWITWVPRSARTSRHRRWGSAYRTRSSRPPEVLRRNYRRLTSCGLSAPAASPGSPAGSAASPWSPPAHRIALRACRIR
jgi:hypothetical protein